MVISRIVFKEGNAGVSVASVKTSGEGKIVCKIIGVPFVLLFPMHLEFVGENLYYLR
jgi:hypothetical protein